MALGAALGWAGAQTGVRIALGFFSAKISAIYLGPAGMALVGQLASFIQLAQGAIGNGAATGVVNLTVERHTTPEQLVVLWSTALRLVLALGCALALVATLASTPLAAWLLADADYWSVVVAAGVATMLVVADSIILAALNGLKQVDLIAKAGIASAVVEFSVFASLVYVFGVWGGLFGIAAIYAAKLLISCAAAFRSGFVSPRSLAGQFDFDTLRKILPFYPMLLAHSIALPLSQILVRDSVIDGLGLEQAGFLQATWRLSDMYVGVMTTALGLYFMAHYSGLRSEAERATLLRRTILQLLSLTTVAATSIYILRELIIRLVLTPTFLPIGDLLPLHLLGDVFKMIGYPLMMALTAQRRLLWYIALAAGGPAIFVILTHVWLPHFGVQSAPAAYAASYLAVLLALLLALGRALLGKSNS